MSLYSKILANYSDISTDEEFRMENERRKEPMADYHTVKFPKQRVNLAKRMVK